MDYRQRYLQAKYRANAMDAPVGLMAAVEALLDGVVLGFMPWDHLDPDLQASALLVAEASSDSRGNLWDRRTSALPWELELNATRLVEAFADGARGAEAELWEALPLGDFCRALLAPGRVAMTGPTTSLVLRDARDESRVEVEGIPLRSCLFLARCSCCGTLGVRACAWCCSDHPVRAVPL